MKTESKRKFLLQLWLNFEHIVVSHPATLINILSVFKYHVNYNAVLYQPTLREKKVQSELKQNHSYRAAFQIVDDDIL